MTAALQVATAWAHALVHAGVRHVVVSPGARSGPLAVAAATLPALEVVVHSDERAAAFLALGLVRGSRRPVAFVCTSGSAGAHALPAVVEASATASPLVICTADRPAELQDCGAAQVMDQVGLFRNFVVDDASVPVVADPARWTAVMRTTVARLLERACAFGGGPVHLNIPLPEPLLPTPGAWRQDDAPAPSFWMSGAASPRGRSVDARTYPWFSTWAGAQRRAIVVGSQRLEEHEAKAVLQMAWAWAAPVVADPVSGLREIAAPGDPLITAGHALLSQPPVAEQMRPQVVLRVGGVPVSRAITDWMSSPNVPAVVVASARDIPDPHRTAAWVLRAPVVEVTDALVRAASGALSTAYLDAWMGLERVARAALAQGLVEVATLDARAVDAVWRMLPRGAHLQVASSMPIRWLDLVAGLRSERGGSVAASRGVNGIDGTFATGWGETLGRGDTSAWCVLGDLAFLHDLGSLLLHRTLPVPMRAVVLQNDGGGIFHHLPFAGSSDTFERVFGTPHGQRAAPLAAAAGWQVATVTSADELPDALRAAAASEGSSLVEVVDNREASVAAWRALLGYVRDALPPNRRPS